MDQTEKTEWQITRYFKDTEISAKSEQAVIEEIFSEIYALKGRVSNRDLVSGLIERLETEKDLASLDLYRRTLERLLASSSDTELP